MGHRQEGRRKETGAVPIIPGNPRPSFAKAGQLCPCRRGELLQLFSQCRFLYVLQLRVFPDTKQVSGGVEGSEHPSTPWGLGGLPAGAPCSDPMSMEAEASGSGDAGVCQGGTLRKRQLSADAGRTWHRGQKHCSSKRAPFWLDQPTRARKPWEPERV